MKKKSSKVDFFVTELVKDETGRAFVERAESFKDLEIDSIALVALCMEIEEEFTIGISNDDVETLVNGTVGDLIKVVEEKIRV